MTKSIYPCLWFNGNAKEAAALYCSVFENSKINSENNVVVELELSGRRFIGLNGGPLFTKNPSVSFLVVYETEEEINEAWAKLSEGGMPLMPLDKYDFSKRYGWIQDRYGASWQLYFGNMKDVGQKITPTLMFTGEQNGRAKEAIGFYTSVFPDSSISGIMEYTEEDPDTTGNVKHAQFILDGHVFMAMESSLEHHFTFNEGISFVVECETQKEIDYFWNALSVGGSEGQCGWLKDQFGVSWQIVPAVLKELMSDPERSKRVMDVFMKMKKFDIEKLPQA
jgi:predicted 3-demethylubiquinone-9 3-methyltransferase (glyoxalase superfamily)